MFWRRWFDGAGDGLDAALFDWTPQDALKARDLLNGGILCVSRTGGGKTSSMKRVAAGIVDNHNSCGLVCGAKPEDLAMWQAIFKAAGRSGDLLVFGPESKLRFNFLADVMRSGGDTREITRCITTIAETLRPGDRSNRGENAEFFKGEQQRMIHNAVEVVRLATGTVTAPDLQRFITTAALNADQLKSPDWRDKFHCRAMQVAFDAGKSPIGAHDFQVAADYWLGEYPNMADRTRSSILTGVLGILHVFNSGIVRELVSGDTNVSPDDMLRRRKWVFVDMAPTQYGDSGRFVNAGWKYLTQRRVLLRRADPGDAFHVCWCDEAQQFVNSFDSEYIAQCRSHLGCLVYLTQSVHSMYSALGGESGRHDADGLLANFSHKIFFALGDTDTAEWASGLLGKRLETFIGGSMQPQQDVFDAVMGYGQFTGSFSTHYEYVVQPGVFINGLRTGGKANGYVCDGIVMRSGEPFSNGENYLPVTFRQR